MNPYDAVGSVAVPAKKTKSAGCCGEKVDHQPDPVPAPQTQEPMAAYFPAGQADIACGVTTAYRPQTGPRDAGHGPTLTKCLSSVCANDILPTVFAEPGACLAGVEPWVPVVQRTEKHGIFRNWVAMTDTLLDMHTPYVMTLQDDCRLSPKAMEKVREFIADWPADCCMLSLYTAPSYATEGFGFSVVDQNRHSSKKLLGAVGWLFKRETLVRVRDTKVVCGTPKIRAAVAKMRAKYPEASVAAGWSQTTDPKKERTTALDICVGQGLLECGLKCYVHNPSLSQHIAEDSSVGHPPASHKGVHAEMVLT